jgi:lysozyme family protein
VIMDFDTAFQRLLGHEGDYVSHPADPGMATRYGITQRVARANGYTGDMRVFPLDLAKKIAKASYWDVVHADEVPAAVRFDLFDTAYNSGPVQAAKLMQRALGVKDDGVLGPVTLAAMRAADGFRLMCRFNGERLDFLNDLPQWPSFSRGWTQRIAENLKAA